jgi:Golgi SNAP receptor complex protein 2
MMTDAGETYRVLIQHKSEIDSNIATVERSNDAPSISVQQRLSFLLNEFSKGIENLRDQVKNQDSKTRMIWDTRISRLTQDNAMMRAMCERRMGLILRAQKEQQDREYLFGKSSKEADGNQQQQLLAESSSLRSSHNMMEAITDQSKAILERILGQNATLKNARGKLYDLINNAGMGQSLSNSIHARERADALILYGCMILTLVIFALLWWFVR